MAFTGRNTKRFIVILAGLLLLSGGCSSPQPKEPPAVKTRNIFSDDPSIIPVLTETESALVEARARALVAFVVAKDAEGILSLIHESGAYVDVKAEKTKPEIQKSLANPEDPLYIALWDTKGYQKMGGDPSLVCFRDSFLTARQMDLDLFFYSETEVEVRLVYENRPPSGVMGNPIFHKIDGQWYVRGIF